MCADSTDSVDSRKGPTLNKSLSVVLPIHNAQSSLTQNIELLLDVLSDLTSDFQIVIVDDASTDLSAEVAADISSRYPQVNLLSNRERLGIDQSVERGRESARGEMVFVHNGTEPMNLDAIAMQYRAKRPAGSVLSMPKPIDESLVERLVHWGDSIDKGHRSSRPERSGLESEFADEQSVLDQAEQLVGEGRRMMRLSDPRDTHHVPAHLRPNRRELENREKEEFWF